MAMASQPLEIIIVGAGIGGFTTAAALRKSGHRVKIYESYENKSEIGAGVGMQTNSMRVLNWLGIERANLRGTDMVGVNLVDAVTTEGQQLQWAAEDDPSLHGVGCHRSDLHNELKRLATSGDAMEAPPAELFLGQKVVSCDPDAGSITLASGEVVVGDVVVGADGVHSVVRAAVIEDQVQAAPTGWACFRAIFDATNRKDFPELAWIDKEGLANVRAPTAHLNEWIIYLVRDKSMVNLVAFVPDTEPDNKPWAETVDISTIREVYAAANYHPSFLRLFDLPTAGPAVRWQLRAMPILPTWTRGRALIMGDAAHATLPLLAQGAGMAVEEAATLAILLPAGTSNAKDEIEKRLKGWQEMRKERGELVNVESVAQANPASRKKFMNQQELRMRLVGYDTIKTAEEYTAKHFAA
ncbi:FAD/NAD(P)-binding domain-containing protein [Mycena kentingensis (nom. inval.)]|nr:FAD/NAD(P)-binding domain-containing protein [Mycena kentingensis (nom. inval.)]